MLDSSEACFLHDGLTLSSGPRRADFKQHAFCRIMYADAVQVFGPLVPWKCSHYPYSFAQVITKDGIRIIDLDDKMKA